MGGRVTEVATVLAELLPAIKAAGKSSSVDAVLPRVVELLKKMKGFLDLFSKRSYLSRLFKGHADTHSLEVLDKELTDSLLTIGLIADRANLQFQQASFAQMQKIASMIEEKGGAQGIQNDEA